MGGLQLTMATPEQFFHKIEEKRSLLNVWAGELYLELHRGTYTTHAATKLGEILHIVWYFNNGLMIFFAGKNTGDRRGTIFLQAIEVACVLAKLANTQPYPQLELTELWKLLLLNQFHDVLPVCRW